MVNDNLTDKEKTLLEIIHTPDREKNFSAANNKTSQAKAPFKTSPHRIQSDEQQADRTFPDDIRRGFYIRADHFGHQHIYADSQGKREIFQETNDGLRTKNSDTHAVKLMLDTITHRGWESIHVKGAEEFRREAWLEGQARGIVVSGYKPNELDLQELKNRERGYLRNEITSQDKTNIRPDQEKSSNKHAREKQPTYRDGIEGILIEQGQRPYKDNPKEDNSPYIIVQDNQGNQKTIWGVGLPDALLKSGAKEQDHIRIREAGMETITKNILREIDGQKVRVPYQVKRRAWEAEIIKQREDEQTQREVQHNHPPQDNEPRENKAHQEVSRDVASLDHTLHVGPGRDVALEDGIYANEARAKEYMAAGRVAAGRMPELKNAAAIEAYIERKVKQKFPHDPVLLQRVMQTARNKIGHAVARGYDFPQPRVVDKGEFEKQRREQDYKQQNTQIENEQNQEREHDRSKDRSR